ncbi:hypothetical protein [Rhizobium sp. PL01]|uniref:hypothetical protein n=1 Tax=Rhizobium sp. PL01 TaxID=3085631 RepID=UPI00298248A6|nr:hypothetical protein [Rhizobium sp. PL01]MDW5317184.1 hypothetical protein [Rhizobium sp. PL01]
MFWKKKPKAVKVLRSKIVTISEAPELGLLTIQTDQDQVRLIIDQANARQLMEECLKLLGYPATMK